MHAGNVVEASLESQLDAIRAAVAEPGREGPVLLVEPSDNIGGGAPGDGISLLRHMLHEGAAGGADAVVVIDDATSAALLHERTSGQTCTLTLGGRESSLSDDPLTLEVEVLSLSDGEFDLENPNSHLASMVGLHVSMGLCATVRTCENPALRIIVTSKKTAPFDLGQLRSQGIIPEKCDVIAVKAAVAHRAAYDPITSHSFTVATPGPCASDLRTMPFKHVRRPLFPLDEL